MIQEAFTCARKGCEESGTKTTHNQKYCSPNCCRIATNAKIMEKYHEQAAIKRGAKRNCSICGNSLSRYNSNKICSPCTDSNRNTADDELARILDSVAWL